MKKVSKTFCPKSYDNKHIWRHGEVMQPVEFLGLTFLSIGSKKHILNVEICNACGVQRRSK